MANKTRKYVINAIIIFIITGLTVFYLFRSKIITAEGVFSIPFYAFVGCFFLFFVGICGVAGVERLVYGTFTDQISYKKSLCTVIFGHFGSSITPFRSGHFPLKAYYHYKAGVSGSVTVTGFLKCQIIYSAVSITVYSAITVYLAISGISAEIGGTQVKLWLVVATGLGFHIVVFLAVIILAFSKRLQSGTLVLVCKIAKKFKKNFDENNFYTVQSEKLAKFKEQIRIIGSSAYKYIAPALLYAVCMAINGGVQYAAYVLIAGEQFAVSGFFTFYVLNLASAYITNVIPLPGAAGTAEALFLLVFSCVLADPLLGKTLVVWRLSTYYLPVVLEFCLFLFVSFKKRKLRGADFVAVD